VQRITAIIPGQTSREYSDHQDEIPPNSPAPPPLATRPVGGGWTGVDVHRQHSKNGNSNNSFYSDDYDYVVPVSNGNGSVSDGNDKRWVWLNNYCCMPAVIFELPYSFT